MSLDNNLANLDSLIGQGISHERGGLKFASLATLLFYK